MAGHDPDIAAVVLLHGGGPALADPAPAAAASADQLGRRCASRGVVGRPWGRSSSVVTVRWGRQRTLVLG